MSWDVGHVPSCAKPGVLGAGRFHSEAVAVDTSWDFAEASDVPITAGGCGSEMFAARPPFG